MTVGTHCLCLWPGRLVERVVLAQTLLGGERWVRVRRVGLQRFARVPLARLNPLVLPQPPSGGNPHLKGGLS